VAEHIDKEIEAIKAVLNALEPLAPDVRANVLEYVLGRLQIVLEYGRQTRGADVSLDAPEGVVEAQVGPVHIKDLKERKNPRSANEMAALVAYYLANMAPKEERKNAITTKDIETYFKIADFPLPEKTQFTLTNAKGAGYLDAVGNGEYKLNAVGHNLVVHGMPRGAERTTTSRRRRPVKNGRRTAKRK